MFNEDTRVKIPATIQLMRLGYNYQSQKDEEIDGETRIFKRLMKKSLSRINDREFEDAEIDNIISEILLTIKHRDSGKQFYQWLTNPLDKVKLIDFENIHLNDFSVVNELTFGVKTAGAFRPDINILINGIPLAFLEVKRPNNEQGIQAEFNRILNDRLKKPENEKYFNLLQIISFSNNMDYEEDEGSELIAEDPKAGSFYTTPNGQNTTFNFFREEDKKVDGFIEISDEQIKEVLVDNNYRATELDTPEFQVNLERTTPCNRFVTSIFDKERLLYLLKHGIIFVDEKRLEKHIMRYPQFFASRNIVKCLDNNVKKGIVWHTQGSGKTALSAFSSRIIHDYFSKKGINTRFYFVVDRLDLAIQSAREFESRGFYVETASSKADFAKELSRVLPMNSKMDSVGEFTVVNIQKFTRDFPKAKNEYDTKIQRVFYIDEAHRSYASNGDFFRNLMGVDEDAIFIALTGTPLLSKKERSNLKFGDYIHKYFYDKSIADGYTLRIKKEQIDTASKSIIHQNLELEEEDGMNEEDIYETESYVASVGDYIAKDFNGFRLINQDKTIGGMIVCNSNNQAKMMKKWFDENKELTRLSVGLVITDESIPTQVNKEAQITFKERLDIDLLIVHKMLTTGYDVKRLKKMYLLKLNRKHTLLQTISRVNRPYKNPEGKVYKYGYITDFVDIGQEYEETIADYLKELESDFSDGDENYSLKGVIVGPNEIYEQFKKAKSELEALIQIDNAELFTRQLNQMDKTELYEVRKWLKKLSQSYRELELSKVEFDLLGVTELQLKRLTRETKNRIVFLNLSSQTVNTMTVLSNEEVVEIVYNFIKSKVSIVDFKKVLEEQQSESARQIANTVGAIDRAIKSNRDTKDINLIRLDELLQKIFERLGMASMSELDGIHNELKDILEQINQINEENERIAAVYNGDYAFVRTYNDYKERSDLDLTKEELERILVVINEQVGVIRESNKLLMQGRANFISVTLTKITKILLKERLNRKVNLKELLDALYSNMNLY